MIRDIKLGFRILKYGLNYKVTMVGLLICCVGGLLMQFAEFGILYVGIGAMLVIQLIHSVSVSTMVQTSPYKKKIQTTVPTLFAAGGMLITNTISVIAQWLGHQRAVNNTNPNFIITYAQGEYETGFLFSSFALVFIVLYGALSMKCFWLGLIIFLGGFFGFMKFAVQGEISYIMMPEWLAIVLSYVITLLGCLAMYAISCITYKRDYSKRTFDNLLKRAA